MLVAVISDTHLFEPSRWFRRVFEEHLAPADAVIHCGDVTGPGMLAFLEASHPHFHGVRGNMCDLPSGGLSDRLSVELAGFRVGAAHGWGPRSEVPLRVAEAFGPDYDVVCFGHTHRYTWLCHGTTWLLNPGALQEGEGSFALLTLSPGKEPEARQVLVK